jgi:hypothetical protein
LRFMHVTNLKYCLIGILVEELAQGYCS